MTFVKPYLGVFAYEGILPSAVMNNINNDWPNALDKTGDGYSNGGGISGQIDILSTGFLKARSGSLIELASGSSFTNSPSATIQIELGATSYIEVDSGSNITFNTGSTSTQAGTETVASGGSITAVTGGAIDTATGGNINVASGGAVNIATGAAIDVSGGTVAVSSGSVLTSSTGTIETGVAGSLILGGGASDWPTFSTPRTRTIEYHPAALITALDPPNYPPSNWTIALESASLPCLVGVGTTVVQYIPFNPPNGSTINSLTMNIVVTHSHSAVPVMPKINVVRSQSDARTTPASLNSGAGQLFVPTPGTGAAWQAGAALQNWTFTANQANVVDTSQYNYYLVLTDENGANAWGGNEYPSFTITYTLANMQPA